MKVNFPNTETDDCLSSPVEDSGQPADPGDGINPEELSQVSKTSHVWTTIGLFIPPWLKLLIRFSITPVSRD